MEGKLYAVYTSKIGEYSRRLRNGTEIELKPRVAKAVSKEVADILKDSRNIVIITDIDDKQIDFKKRLIKEDWKELVKRHGIQKAKEIRNQQEEK